MSTTTQTRPQMAARTLPRSRRTRHLDPATLWVVALVWVLPLAGFAVATARDPQGETALLGVMTVVLLIPVGLVALVLVRALPGLGWRPPAFVLALASALGGAAAGAVLLVLGDLLTS